MAVDNAAGFAQLQRMIEDFRALGTIAEDAAPAVADALRMRLTETISAGTDFDGAPWAPTQAGTKPLQHAADALTVRAIGPVVVATLTGPTALHHLGAGRGRVQRRVLPGAASPVGRVLGLRELFGGRMPRAGRARVRR